MKSICVFIRDLTPGGAQIQSIYLSHALQLKHRPFLVALKGDIIDEKYKDYLLKNNIDYFLLDGSLIKRVVDFYKILKKHRTDIIFSYLASNNFWASVAGKILGIKNIIGGIRNAKLDKKKFYIQRFIHNHISKLTIFNNLSGIDNLSDKGFNKDKCVFIPNCVPEIHDIINRENNNIIKILSVGRFVPQKDFKTSLKSVRYLLDNFDLEGKQVVFNIIGFGALEMNIRKWINKYGMEDIVNVIINPDNITKYYSEADIYLCTSIFEGLSNVLLEAMNYCLPVIATDVGDNRLLVENNTNGYLVSPHDHENTAKYLYELIHSFDLRHELGINSNKLLKKNYSFDIFQRRYFEFIDNLAE